MNYIHLFLGQINVSVMLPFLKESKKHSLPPSFSLFKENENLSKLEEQLNYFFVIIKLIYWKKKKKCLQDIY